MFRSASTCLLNCIKHVRGPGKSGWYRMMRSRGLRPYSSKFDPHNNSELGDEFEDLYREPNEEWLHNISDKNVSRLDKFREKHGLQGSLKYLPAKLQNSGLRMYMCCEVAVQYNNLFQELTLPDTFGTWHQLVGLHVWLCMVRLQQEGRDGKIVVDQMFRNFDIDTKERQSEIEKLMGLSVNRKAVQRLHVQLMENIQHLDEGLLGSDMQMAGSLWKTIFNASEDVELRELELMVEYVRKQIAHLETYTSETVLNGGLLAFISPHGYTIPDSVHQALETIEQKHP